jgi:two-component system alkaline phosphatase synthesis response regulator PhoP
MRTILLVEDSAVLRETLRYLLEDSGFCVIACSDGPSAIEQAHNRVIDVMLVDFRMPGLNGLDVVKIVRERRPRVCIIGMSLEDRENVFLAAGADAFLMKPFDIEELVRIAAKVDERECIGK